MPEGTIEQPLSASLPRDCGHECKVCQVTAVSLTDYAGHISSAVHKQNVEAAGRRDAGNDDEEEYFDRDLVDLIEKRKELIRKEEEAAAAKQAKEEAERKKQQEFQQRLKEAKERLRQDRAWRAPPRGFGGSNRQEAWYGNNISGRAWESNAKSKAFHHSKQGKSATWHAQQPPNFQNMASGNWAGGSLHSQEGWGNKQWDQGAFSGNQRGRLPWLSNRGSSNGVYGWNNIAQCPQNSRPLSLLGHVPRHPPPSSFFAHPMGDIPGHQNGERSNTECERYSGIGSKTFGSNPKLDKAGHRWSPYPPTKLFDAASEKDAQPSPSEQQPKAPPPQRQDKAPDQASALSRQSRSQQNPKQSSCGDNVGKGKKRHKNKKDRDRSSSSSRCSSGRQTSPSAPSKQKAEKTSEHRNRKLSLISSKASSQEHEKPTSKHSGLSSRLSDIGQLQSRKEQQISDMPKKERDKRGVVDLSSGIKVEMALHIVEEQHREGPESQDGVNKENTCRQDGDSVRCPPPCGEERVKLPSPSLDSSHFLQLVQVSPSTVESSGPVEEAEDRKSEQEGGDAVTADETMQAEGGDTVTADEAMQAVEAGQGSESDASRSSEASAAPGLSKLGLPPVLKRDLTKHVSSSKSKTGTSHEPNLNHARRVRHVSESRRGETEKESGLKPTVRQLISSSGSRRNVNWDQVYQEVRKKQDQGKGMPRFGIEMVSCDQEDQSQEEEDIRLLEGFQWEALVDNPAPGSHRKRSLSESSLAPDCSASSWSAIPSQISGERAHREGPIWPGIHGSDQQGSPTTPNPVWSHGNRDHQQEQEDEPMLGQREAKAQKASGKMAAGTAKALQRSDSALGDSSSGAELYDGQGTGKKRRAAGDIPVPDLPCLERKNKRRKIKSKRERLQVDQLLAVSLREEELSLSLHTVDNSLIQARVALQSAYLEVQRLMVVKQEVTEEMTTLRNKRIELLKGMQGGLEDSPQPKGNEDTMDSAPLEPPLAPVLSPSQAAQCASPPSSTHPFTPVLIKQEPLSPGDVLPDPMDNTTHCPHSTSPELPRSPRDVLDPVEKKTHCPHSTSPELPLSPRDVLDPVEKKTHCPHSTSPELPVPPAAACHPDLNCPLSPEERPELYRANGEPTRENLGAAAEGEERSPGEFQMVDRSVQASRDCLTPVSDTKPPPLLALSSASRRSSEAGSVADPTPSFPNPLVLIRPLSPSELRNAKRVRRLKKRRVLNKAQGGEQPESSDTEAEEEASRPRWIRARRRASGGSHGSTSTPPTAVEDEDGDRVMHGDGDVVKEASGLLSLLAAKAEEEDLMVKLPQAPPTEGMKLELSESEESMEVTPAPVPTPVPAPVPAPASCRAEVTSTSDMDVSPVVKPDESDVQMPLASPTMSKTSLLDASSDPGEDDLPSEGVFEGHQETVNAMLIHKDLLYTCSGDRTVKAFSLASRKCVTVFEGHSSKVNCLLVSAAPGLHNRLYSGSSDQTIRCYSLKTREFEQQFSLPDRVLCLHSRWKVLYAGLANGSVVTFNLKTNKQLDVFECHGPRAVSCLASAQEGALRILLVGSYDSTISVRDAKNGLLLRTLQGHAKTVLCMKVVNDLVFSGSSDQSVHAYNIHSGELVRVYRGHSHAVTVVAVLGKVMVTACLDKVVRVYELQSQEQLQVYGGHKDMVMCMAVHKSMIYTGCYDGSVQAVRLNLMQSYRCRWSGCSLAFGVRDHLAQHLIGDHTSPKFQTLKCRWKNCDEFFCARNGSKQGIPLHMQRHAEEETLPEGTPCYP